MCFGCTELVNDARTIAYHKWAGAEKKYSCGSCIENVQQCYCELDGVPDDYTDPVTDEAPWYDAAIPESEDFLGILVQSVNGARGSTYSRGVGEAITEGSVFQRSQLGGRTFVFEVVLLGTSCAGLEYGWDWVRRTLEEGACGNTGCTSCAGEEMLLRVFCPEAGEPDNGLRTWTGVATVDGMNEVSDESFQCCCYRRATFTLHSESPYSYSNEQGLCVLDADPGAYEKCIDWGTFCVNCNSSNCVACTSCGEETNSCAGCRAACGPCDRCGYDPLCPQNNIVKVLPLFIEDTCFCEPITKVVQCCTVDNLPSCVDTTFRLELFSGAAVDNDVFTENGLRNVRLKIWENPLLLPPPTDDATYEPWKLRDPCAQLDIAYVPSDTRLVVDGRNERITLECAGRCLPYSQVVSSRQGTQTFPLTAVCHDLLICVEWDAVQTQFDAVGVNKPSSLTVDSFLRWRS